MIKAKIEKVSISSIKENAANPRTINKHKFQKLVNSVKEFPEMLSLRPIIVDKDNIILGGNMRYKACKELGLKEVYIIQAADLDDKQAQEFIVKDNVGFGEWDWDILANDWDVKELEEWGLDGFPFEEEVLEAEEDDFDVVDGGVETDIVLGDLFEIGEHRLLCGDSTCSDTVANLMDGKKADMVFTDPPYNINFKGTLGCTTKDGKIITMKDGYSTPNSSYEDIKNDKKTKSEFNEFISAIISIIKLNTIGGWYICFSSSTLNELLTPLVDLGLYWKSIIIWNKNQSPLGGGHFRKKYEPIVYGYFENNFYGNEYAEDDVWDLQRTLKNDLHPTMKPIPLCEKALNYSSKLEDVVLDLFLGSGSTMVAAHQLKRKCYGMELDPKYCQVIIDRMLKLDDTLIIKRNGKQYNSNNS